MFIGYFCFLKLDDFSPSKTKYHKNFLKLVDFSPSKTRYNKKFSFSAYFGAINARE